LLAQEIEKEHQQALKAEDPSKSEDIPSAPADDANSGATVNAEDVKTSVDTVIKPSVGEDVEMSESASKPTNTRTDTEGDVKMEDR